jgi:hypothetical protein
VASEAKPQCQATDPRLSRGRQPSLHQISRMTQQLGTCLNFVDLRCVRTPILPCSRARFLRKALKLLHDFCATSSSNYPPDPEPDPDIGPTSIPTPIDRRSLILSNLCCLFTPAIERGYRRLHNNLIMATSHIFRIMLTLHDPGYPSFGLALPIKQPSWSAAW